MREFFSCLGNNSHCLWLHTVQWPWYFISSLHYQHTLWKLKCSLLYVWKLGEESFMSPIQKLKYNFYHPKKVEIKKKINLACWQFDEKINTQYSFGKACIFRPVSWGNESYVVVLSVCTWWTFLKNCWVCHLILAKLETWGNILRTIVSEFCENLLLSREKRPKPVLLLRRKEAEMAGVRHQ